MNNARAAVMHAHPTIPAVARRVRDSLGHLVSGACFLYVRGRRCLALERRCVGGPG